MFKLTVLSILGAAVWVWRPLFHGLLYRAVYSPGGVYVVLLPLLVAVVLFLAPPFGTDGTDIGIILAMSLGAYGIFLEERTLVQDAMMGDFNET